MALIASFCPEFSFPFQFSQLTLLPSHWSFFIFSSMPYFLLFIFFYFLLIKPPKFSIILCVSPPALVLFRVPSLSVVLFTVSPLSPLSAVLISVVLLQIQAAFLQTLFPFELIFPLFSILQSSPVLAHNKILLLDDKFHTSHRTFSG